MRADLERNDFMELLDKLSSEDDAEILAAVRDINAKMTVAGVTWDDLLISQDGTAPEGADDYVEDYDDDDDDDEEAAAEPEDAEEDADSEPLTAEEKQEAASLITAIRALQISDLTKEELTEYEDDLKHDEFAQMDLRYLRALKARLSA